MDREQLREHLAAAPRVYWPKPYAVFAALTVLIVGHPAVLDWIYGFEGERSARDYVTYAVLVFLTFPLITRMFRVDGDGVHRKWVFFWTHWPWEDFESGEIRKGHGRYYYERSFLPVPGSSLPLHGLSKEDWKEILGICRQFWNPPPRTVPRSLEATTRSRHVQLHPEGITLRVGNWKKKQLQYGWDDVRSITVEQVEPDDEDFVKLRIEIPRQTLRFRTAWSYGSYGKYYSGPDADEILAFIEHYAPPEKIEYSFASERKSGEDRIQELEKQVGRVPWGGLIFSLFFAGLAVVASARATSPWSPGRVLGVGVLAGIALLVAVDTVRDRRRKSRELDQLRATGESPEKKSTA